MSGHIRVFSLILAGFALLGSSASAFALSDELTAVERHCGAPGAESKETSDTSGQLQRTLIYNSNLYLHFEPVAGGWGFTSAWAGHLPMTRTELESRLPCFRTAMQESAKAVPAGTATDPSIAAQTAHPAHNDATFGIPHLALIVILGITLLVFILIPSARQRKLAQQIKPVGHIYRKPDLEEYIAPPLPEEAIKYRKPELVAVLPTPLATDPPEIRKVEVVEVLPAQPVVEQIEPRKTEVVEVVQNQPVMERIAYRKTEVVEVLHTQPVVVEPIGGGKAEVVEVIHTTPVTKPVIEVRKVEPSEHLFSTPPPEAIEPEIE